MKKRKFLSRVVAGVALMCFMTVTRPVTAPSI